MYPSMCMLQKKEFEGKKEPYMEKEMFRYAKTEK